MRVLKIEEERVIEISYWEESGNCVVHDEKVFSEFKRGKYMIEIKVYWHNSI
jgi:hypothetical protein